MESRRKESHSMLNADTLDEKTQDHSRCIVYNVLTSTKVKRSLLLIQIQQISGHVSLIILISLGRNIQMLLVLCGGTASVVG